MVDKRVSIPQSEGDINVSPRRMQWQETSLDDPTRAMLEEDAHYFLHQSLSTPCLNALEASEGIYIVDLQGKRYMDFHGNALHQVGYGNPEVLAAIKEQLDQLPFCPRRYTNRSAVELAKKLVGLVPDPLGKVLFCPGGAEAIGIALKLARVATGRYKTLSMWDSFHGATLDAISIGGEALFRKGIGPLLPGTEHVPPPDEYHCQWDCLQRGGCDLKCADYVEYVMEKEGDIGAMIAEPVRLTPSVPHPDYWPRVRESCDRHGALLIFDEIPNALGRTGRMFAFEHFDVVPDILVLGKGLGGGVFPLAAVVARADLDRVGDQALGHYTHEKNPVACAAGLAAINYIEHNGLVDHARDLGDHALGRMRAMMESHELIGEVRGLGLLLGIVLVNDRGTRERAVEQAEAVMYAALRRGLNFKVTMGNILQLTPPLIIERNQLDDALDILDASLAEVVQGA